MEQQSAEDRWMCALCNKGLTENTPVTDKKQKARRRKSKFVKKKNLPTYMG